MPPAAQLALGVIERVPATVMAEPLETDTASASDEMPLDEKAIARLCVPLKSLPSEIPPEVDAASAPDQAPPELARLTERLVSAHEKPDTLKVVAVVVDSDIAPEHVLYAAATPVGSEIVSPPTLSAKLDTEPESAAQLPESTRLKAAAKGKVGEVPVTASATE